MNPEIKEFFDPDTWTLTYVVFDPLTKDAVILDPVWNYDPGLSQLHSTSADQIFQFVQSLNLKIHFILETHAHADHISASQLLKRKLPGTRVGIGIKIIEIQKIFKKIFNMDSNFKTDGSQFDLLIQDGQSISAGSIMIKALSTPGHTPACQSYIIGESVFTGDTLFMPDYGTGRCDFPSGSAKDLYESIHEKIYKLPDHFSVYVGHDYQPNGRPLIFKSSIGEQKKKNIHLKHDTTLDEFVHFREARDKTLAPPKLLLPSVQVNMGAGILPKPDENGSRYLKIPIAEIELENL